MVNLITLFILVLIGAIIYWIIGKLPIKDTFKTILYIILALIAVVYLLSMLPGAPFSLR